MSAVSVPGATVRGSVDAPPSKSYTHRALLVGHLSRRAFRIDRPLDSDDTRATVRAIRALGSAVVCGRGRWTVRPRARPHDRTPVRIDAGESGTTLRFALAAAALRTIPSTFTGRGRLPYRPIAPLARALGELGATCRTRRPGRSLPLEVVGPLHGGSVDLDASSSSQFASALLLALPTVATASTVRLKGELVSEPYLDATLAVLHHHHVRARRAGRLLRIPGAQRYRGDVFTVPSDASSSAYLWAAGALAGGPVCVRGEFGRWPQADLAVLDLLRRYGARVLRRPDRVTVRAGVRRPFRVDLTRSPDLLPLAGVIAATAPGTSTLVGAAHASAKESDRRAETARLVRALGARATDGADGLRVDGARSPRAFVATHLKDHRLVMSAAVGALAAEGRSLVGDATAVRKSYPGFWGALFSLVERRRR